MYKLFPILLLFFFACNNKTTDSATGFIKAGNYNVYYEEHGKGEAILLIHAGLQDHTMWDKQVEALSKNYKVVTIDLPYHGKTTGHDTSLLAKDVIKIVLDSLHIEKASIAGLSMGSAVTQDFVIAYPQRINKAIFISSGINGYEKHFTIDSLSLSWYGNFTAALEAKDTAKAAMLFTRTWSEGIDSKSNTLTKEASKYVYTTTLRTLKEHRLQSWPHLENNPPAMENITKIKLPVLIIHGDKDIPIINAASLYLEKTIKGSKRVLIKDVAHMLNLEKPEEVNELLLNFLQERK